MLCDSKSVSDPRRCARPQKCSDSSFCRRLRGKAGDVYALQSDSLRVEGAKLVGKVVNEANQAQFDLTLTSYGDTVRLLVDEAAPNHRYQVTCQKRERASTCCCMVGDTVQQMLALQHGSSKVKYAAVCDRFLKAAQAEAHSCGSGAVCKLSAAHDQSFQVS